MRKRDAKWELKTAFKNCSVDTLIELCEMKSPYVEISERCMAINRRASNWKFPDMNPRKDVGSGKTKEWVFKFIRNDVSACRTDLKQFYFDWQKITHVTVRKNVNFLAPYEAHFLDDGYAVRTYVILGQRIANDARLLESFPH